VLQGHRKAVTSLVLYEGFLYSGSYDRTVRAWNTETGECVGIYHENDNWITAVAVAEPYMYCGGYDCVVNVYDVKVCIKLTLIYNNK
jgi:F-box/WD-40 domain protein 7